MYIIASSRWGLSQLQPLIARAQTVDTGPLFVCGLGMRLFHNPDTATRVGARAAPPPACPPGSPPAHLDDNAALDEVIEGDGASTRAVELPNEQLVETI